jgi:hypothetical protein
MRRISGIAALVCTAAGGVGCCAVDYTLVVESANAPINDGYPVKVDIIIARSKDNSDQLEKADVARWFDGARDDYPVKPTNLTVPGEKTFRRTIQLKVGKETDYGGGAPSTASGDILRIIPEDLDALYVFAHYRGASDAFRKKRIPRDTFMCQKGRLIVDLGKNQIREVRLQEP